jgi:hypothetical protein
MSNHCREDTFVSNFYLTAIPCYRTFEFFKDHFIHFEPVSVNAVAIILKDPPFSTLRAAQRIVLAFVVH